MLTSIELVNALQERYPDLAGLTEFLGLVLVVEGLAPDFTEELMRNRFSDSGRVVGSCFISDSIGRRVGVVVFDSAASCSAAARSEPASPSYSRATEATSLDMMNRRRCYRHLSNLIGVLHAVSPAVMDDPKFLERSILLAGVARNMSPSDLLVSADFEAEKAVIVRDAEFGDRIGLLVLRDASDYATALAAIPPRGCYCGCFPARGARLTRLQILGALDDSMRRQPTADLFRSLIPPMYIRDDKERDLHLYCVFLRGISDAGGARGLCRIATDKLLYMGSFNAVIIQKDVDVGVLVCHASLAPDAACAMAHRLTESNSRLVMYDSSLFPLPAAREASPSLARRLLPLFVTPAEYTSRVVLLTGLDSSARDAAKVAGFVEGKFKRDMEAVIVHGGGDVLVVVQTAEDAQALLQVPREKWRRAGFGPAIECTLFEVPAIPAGRPEDALLKMRMLEPSMVGVASSHIAQYCLRMLDKCRIDDIRKLVCGLYGLAHEVHPTGLGRGYFLDRSVLLRGIRHDLREWDLRSALMRFGPLDGLVCHRKRGVGLAIFESWIGASRMLRESAATWRLLGFSHCRRAPPGLYNEFIVDLMVWSYYKRRSRGGASCTS